MDFLLGVFAAVALLIWGTHIVTNGVLKGFGSRLRKKIGNALDSRWKAFSTGFGVTLALQSSTATGMMASGFAASGLLALEPGFMLMLGANVGTAVVAKILSFPIHSLAPILLITGVFLPRFAQSSRARTAAEVVLGLGLMLLSLHMLVASLGNLPSSPLAQQIVQGMVDQPMLVIALGAVAAWMCHSSVAVILLSVSLASSGHFPLEAGLATVLGANLGGALGPVLDATGLAARRLPLANLIVRALGVILGGVFLPTLVVLLKNIPWDVSTMLINAHLGFNVVLALLAAPLAKPICKVLMRLLPDPPVPDDPGKPRHLTQVDEHHPPHWVLAAAERESLRVADLLAEQLQYLPQVVTSAHPDHAQLIASRGDSLTVLGAAIRKNMQSVPHALWDAEQRRRAQELGVFVLSMEHNADIIAHQVVIPLLDRHKHEGALVDEHKDVLLRLITSMQRAHELSVTVFLRRDVAAAQALINEKINMRSMEREYLHTRPADAAPTLLNPDIDDDLRLMREMRRVMGQSCAIAYELLDQEGHLRSRVDVPERPPNVPLLPHSDS